MDFKDFKKTLTEAANSHFSRIGRKMLWTYETGELAFLIQFEKDPERPTYGIRIFYSHQDWITRERTQLLCGAGIGIRQLVEKDQLNLQIDYPGTHENFYSIFFNSYLGNTDHEVQTLIGNPELKYLEKRRTDFDEFFTVLKASFDNASNLQTIAARAGVTVPDFWTKVAQRMEDCQQ